MSKLVSNNCCSPQTLSINNTTGYLSISDGNQVYLGKVIDALGIKTPVINFALSGYILTLTYVDSNGMVETRNIDFSNLAQGGSIVVNNTPSIDLVFNSANLSANVNISTAVGNALTIKPDGLYSPTLQETILVANNSSSLAFTTGGIDGHTLSGSVKISSTAGNKLIVDGTGLYVPDTTTYLVQGSNITITGGGTSGNPYVIAAGGFTQTPLSVNDTSTFHFISSGTFGMTLTGNVKVSSVSQNALIVNSDGLYVPQSSTNSYTDAQARAAISSTAPILYNNLTGVISESLATSTSNGYLSASDWNVFNNKISTGANIGSVSSLPVYAGASGTTLNFFGLRASTNVTLNQVGNDIVISATGGGSGGSNVFTIDFIVGDGGALTPTAGASQFNPASNPLAGRTILGVWVEGTKIAGVARTGGVLYYTFTGSTGAINLTNGVFSADTYYSIMYK